MVVIVRLPLVSLRVEILVLVPAVPVLGDRDEVQLLPVLVGGSIVLVVVAMLVRVGVCVLVRVRVHQVAVPMLVLV